MQPGIRQNKLPVVRWDREKMKKMQWEVALERQYQYYTTEESDWLKQNVDDKLFQNMGYWDNAGNFIETHSDVLHTNQMTKFNNWICYVGLDSIAITGDGNIYRSSCGTGGCLGNIETGFTLPDEPVRCPRPVCTTLTDIRVRKCRDASLLHLIDDVDQSQ